MHNKVATFVLVFLAKAFAAGGGLGGGGLLVPIFLLVAQLPPSEAAKLSVCASAFVCPVCAVVLKLLQFRVAR